MQGLLESIVREQARYAIVDLTGVEVVDTSTADHLIQLFRAARVLGVEGILCGIRPAVAQTVVALGLELGSVRTMRSLRDALKWCIRRPRRSTRRDSHRPRRLDAGEGVTHVEAPHPHHRSLLEPHRAHSRRDRRRRDGAPPGGRHPAHPATGRQGPGHRRLRRRVHGQLHDEEPPRPGAHGAPHGRERGRLGPASGRRHHPHRDGPRDPGGAARR